MFISSSRYTFLSSLPVTLIFADRIYHMSKNKYVFVFLCIASVVRLLVGVANFVLIWKSDSISEYLDKWHWVIPTQLGVGLLTDLVITLTLVIYLKRQDKTINQRWVYLSFSKEP